MPAHKHPASTAQSWLIHTHHSMTAVVDKEDHGHKEENVDLRKVNLFGNERAHMGLARPGGGNA